MPKIAIHANEVYPYLSFETSLNGGGQVVDISKAKLEALNALKEAAETYQALLHDLSFIATKKEEEEEELRQCKFRLRPGKLCKSQVIPGTSFCPMHQHGNGPDPKEVIENAYKAADDDDDDED